MKFKELNLKKEVLNAIEDKKFEEPTEIQEKIIPLILEGNDVLGQSQTGTGKTLAFGAPILSKLELSGITQTLILSPTRELAIQISKELIELGKNLNVSITCVYGSSSISEQISKLRKGSEIVVGTPGRVKDLIKRKALKIDKINYFVLDEADEMLSMGFEEDIESIFKEVKSEKQVLLFSATMPKPILKLAQNYMKKDYKMISVITEIKTADNIEQDYYLVSDKTRLESLCRIIDFYNPKKAIIFCKTKRNADEVMEKLSNKKYKSDIIHGDITQDQRIKALDRFKSGVFNYLIATDVAARGIHVDDVDIVVNYNLPENSEAYVHRIGRTGRAHKSGIAITLVKPNEEKTISSIEKQIKTSISKKELPTKEEILLERMNDLISNVEFTKKKSVFNEYVNSLDEESKTIILTNLLEEKLENTIGSDFEVNTTKIDNSKKSKNRNKNTSSDSVRVFVTLGKLDNITKKDYLKYIEEKAGVPEGTCHSFEMMTKFSFMNINNKYYDKVMKTCESIKMNNRTIRIEKAKN